MSNFEVVQAQLARNHGLIARWQAAELGLTESVIDYEVRRGRLVAVHPGVYRSPGTPSSPGLELRAALLGAGPGAALSHRTAARLHGLPAAVAPVELTVPHGRRPRIAGVRLHRSLRLPPTHVVDLDGMAVTTVDRTLGDLGAVVAEPLVRSAVESAVVRRLTTVERLFRHVDDHARRGRSGIGVLRGVLEDWVLGEATPDSELEIGFARVVRRAGLPEPRMQYEVRTPDGRFVARVDAAWPPQRVLVEVDGFRFHGTPQAMQRDLERQNALCLAGWTVLRFTWHDVVRRPGRVATEIRSALDRAGDLV